jgi:hypothetical protein
MTDPVESVLSNYDSKTKTYIARTTIVSNFELEDTGGSVSNICPSCESIIQPLRKPFKFSGYSDINSWQVEELTDHQYFLCERSVEGFLFKERRWGKCTHFMK